MSNQISFKLENNIPEDNRFAGAFIGAAAGDALGFITEFTRSANDLQKQFGTTRLTNLMSWERTTRFQNKYLIMLPIPAGTFSDDTQLTLATSRCLTVDGTFDALTFAKYELPLWLEYQLGGGSGTKAAANNLIKRDVEWYNNFYYTPYTQYVNSGGNGVAMRILPIALVNSQNSNRRYMDIWRNAVTTHGHVRGIMGAILFADAIALLLERPEQKTEWLDKLIDICSTRYLKIPELWEKIPEFPKWKVTWEKLSKQAFVEAWVEVCKETQMQLEIILENIRTQDPRNILARLGCYDKKTKGAGNVSVVAAMFFLCRQEQFEDAVIAVANEIGIDTDTIGYFVGAMFGTYYGIEIIPQRFREKIQDYAYLLQMSDWCYQIYSGEAASQAEFPYPDTLEIPFYSSVHSQLEKATVNSVVELPVLGSGKLLSDTDITPTWKGKHVHWLKVGLDIGQTLYFQVVRSTSSIPTKQVSKNVRQESVVSSLATLDEFKKSLEESMFDDVILAEVIRNIKFVKKDRAIYNAFMTWLWSALPGKDSFTEPEESDIG